MCMSVKRERFRKRIESLCDLVKKDPRHLLEEENKLHIETFNRGVDKSYSIRGGSVYYNNSCAFGR